MTKKYTMCVLCLLASICLPAQDLRTLFVNMPDSLSPLLTSVNRADFGDFLDSQMKAEVKNRFEGLSEMTVLTSDYLFLKETSASTVEMKLLPVNDSVKVICVVRTYLAPVADSKVDFYATDWKELPATDYLQLPTEDAFYRHDLPAAEADSLQNLRRQADMLLVKATLSARSDSLQFVYTTPDYMEKEAARKLRAYLHAAPIVYRWKDGKFVSPNVLEMKSVVREEEVRQVPEHGK